MKKPIPRTKYNIHEPLISKYGYASPLELEGMSIEEAVNHLRSYDNPNYNNIYIDYYYGPDSSYLTIYGEREESDKEFNARVAIEDTKIKKQEEKELKELTRLQKKFNGRLNP